MSFVSPVVDPASGTIQVLVKVPRDAKKVLRPGLGVKLVVRASRPLRRRAMPARPRPSKRRLRSTMDSVLLHDMRNMGFRLGLLLENVEEHFGDPDFKRSVVELLQGTREKLDAMVSRWMAHADSILIKVEVDLNDVRAARSCGSPRPRTAGGPAASVTTDLEELPRVWGDPHYLQDALLSVFENALEAVSPTGGHVTVRSSRGAAGKEALAVVEIEDDGPGMSEDFARGPALPAVPDDEARRASDSASTRPARSCSSTGATSW